MKICLPFLLVIAFAAASAAAKEHPNILMIAVDDLRPMLGCYGDPRAKTPHIDALAEQGMLFERAYCQYSKCGPSRLSLMTGLRADSVAVYGNSEKDVADFRARRPDAVTMAQWLKKHGYETRSFGKIDHDGWSQEVDWSSPPSPGREREMWEVAREDEPLAPTVIAERYDCPVLQKPDVPDDHLFAGRMANEVVSELNTGEREKPFFFAVGFRRPHLPFVAPLKYYQMHQPDESWIAKNQDPPMGVSPVAWFSSDGYIGGAKKLGLTIPLRPSREKAIALNGFELRSYKGVPNSGPISTATQLELLHAYAACVSYVDAQVGRLLDSLQKNGLRENTIVLLWADHGWHLGESGIWGKMTNYEIGTRVPLLIDAPGYDAGRTKSPAGLVDLYPTLCELTGVTAPSHLEGKSLVPVLADSKAEVQPYSESHYARYRGRFIGDTLRTKRYRYHRWVNEDGGLEAEELYDISSDPDEQTNIIISQPKVAEKMRLLFESRRN